MNRREFIKGLSLAPVALLAAPVVAKVVARPKPGNREFWQNLSSDYVYDNGYVIHDPPKQIRRIANIDTSKAIMIVNDKFLNALKSRNEILISLGYT